MDHSRSFRDQCSRSVLFMSTPVRNRIGRQSRRRNGFTAFQLLYDRHRLDSRKPYPGHYAQFLCLNASPRDDHRKRFSASLCLHRGLGPLTGEQIGSFDEGFLAAASLSGPLGGKKELRAGQIQAGRQNRRGIVAGLPALRLPSKYTARGMNRRSSDQILSRTIVTTEEKNRPHFGSHARALTIRSISIYTIGKLQIFQAAREDYRKQEGKKFLRCKKFHDEFFFRHGMPPHTPVAPR